MVNTNAQDISLQRFVSERKAINFFEIKTGD